ncbi:MULTISPECIES: hypothetical protein [Microbacterium]|uniref:hypothetical protein n=1 Tax=Microbacterium TaxID=33882 RepID=UPI00277FC9FC|nr:MULTISPECIES: hypothetical protein [Microbacterium]MDQ1076691.1 hypothetical protein [Microbacterium sp. SORGH_AS_0969]MDQ1116927.1 hypothetical protein [Microbacterium testaceum]
MKKPWIAAGAALVAVLVVGGTAGTVAVAQSGIPATSTLSDSSVGAVASAIDLDRAGSFVLAESEDTASIEGSRLVASAPETSTVLPVSLDVTSIEQYWLWASGVEVTAHGLTPGADVEIGIVFSSGVTKHWAPVRADENGTLVTRVRTLDVDPENTRPEAGLAQITVRSSAGEAGSALLDVTATTDVITVSSDPATISQDEFLDKPVTIHASGFAPMTKMFFNLGMPDTTMFAVGENEGLHSDENGDFSYQLQMNSVNSQVGTWLMSFVSDDRSGSATFQVTAGAARTPDKKVTPARSEISVADFVAEPGMRFALEGFLPFDTYELLLTTSRGYTASLGISRTNGEGRHSNAITSPKGIPEGEYTVTARSTTTGDYAIGTFRVTGNPDAPASEVSLSAGSVTAGSLADSTKGVFLSGRDVTPGTSFRVSLRNGAWERQPLLVGADAYATVGDDGRLALQLVTLQRLAPGTYTVWAEGGGGAAAYNVQLPLEVTADATSTTPSVAPETRLAPVEEAPALPQPTPDTSESPAPAPAPSVSPTPIPDAIENHVPNPALPVPTVPAR